MKKYSIRTIKKYLKKCDSFGDAIYFCTEELLDKYVARKKNTKNKNA